MTSRPARGGTSRWLALEAVTTGLAYGAGLCWASVCLVGSFRPGNLSAPYWSSLPTVRTDNTGIVAFFVVAVCFCTSEYLRLRRRRDTAATPGPAASNGTAWPLLQAASRTVAILATGLVDLPLGECGHASRDARDPCDAPGHVADGGNLAGDSAAPVRLLRRRASLPEGPGQRQSVCARDVAILASLAAEPGHVLRRHPPARHVVREEGDPEPRLFQDGKAVGQFRRRAFKDDNRLVPAEEPGGASQHGGFRALDVDLQECDGDVLRAFSRNPRPQMISSRHGQWAVAREMPWSRAVIRHVRGGIHAGQAGSTAPRAATHRSLLRPVSRRMARVIGPTAR